MPKFENKIRQFVEFFVKKKNNKLIGKEQMPMIRTNKHSENQTCFLNVKLLNVNQTIIGPDQTIFWKPNWRSVKHEPSCLSIVTQLFKKQIAGKTMPI